MIMKKEREWQRGMSGRLGFLRYFIVFGGIIAVGLLVSHAPLCFAKDVYPAGKITYIVPYAPGGGYDTIARVISPYLTKYLREASPGAKGGEMVIKNEPQASGIKAYSMIYNAKPDGYTFGAFDSAFGSETLRTKLDFDINKFTYLLRFNSTTRLVVTSKAGFKNWDEMLKFAQNKELRWCVGGFGRGHHVDSIIIKETLKLPARIVALGGVGECMNAVIRGDVQVVTVAEDAIKGLIDSGEIRVLADFTGTCGYPGVPTPKDLGYPDLAEKVGGHRFYIAPPALPKEISNILTAAFKKALNDREFQAWAKKNAIPIEPVYGDEAGKLAKEMFKVYQIDMKDILLKNLQ